jgi:hypothetical protein
MPKNIIRDSIESSYYHGDIQPLNPEWVHDMNRIQHDQKPQSPIQYMNNDHTSYPFYARNRLSKETKYVDYDFNKDQSEISRSSMIRVASENKYSQPERYK